MDKKCFNKGEYEEATECAKNLLEDGIGMEEIISKTHLNEEQIKKVQVKMKKKLSDEKK